MKNLLTFCGILLFIFSNHVCYGQEIECETYQCFVDKGLDAFEESRFQDAIAQFQAAKVSDGAPNIPSYVDSLIYESQNGSIKVEEKLRKEAEIQGEKADSARKEALSLLLGLLSNNERIARNDSTAILLAYAANAIDVPNLSNTVKTSFGQAVFSHYNFTLPFPNSPIQNIWPSPENPFAVVGGQSGDLFTLDWEQAPSGTWNYNLKPLEDYKHQGEENTDINKNPGSQSGNLVTALKYIPSSSLFISAFQDGSIKKWNYENQQVETFPGHKEKVLNLDAKLNKGEALILSASKDKTARLSNMEGKIVKMLKMHADEIIEAKFVGSNSMLTRSVDRQIGIWNDQGQLISSVGDKDDLFLFKSYYDEYNKTLVALNSNGEVIAWKLNENNKFETLPLDAQTSQFICINKSNQIIAASANSLIQQFDFKGHNLISKKVSELSNIRFFQYFKLQDCLAVGSSEGDIMLNPQTENPVILEGDASIISVNLNPTGSLVLVTYADGRCRLWNNTGLLLYQFELDTQNPMPADFSNDGQLIIVPIKENKELLICPIPSVGNSILKKSLSAYQNNVLSLEEKYSLDLSSFFSQDTKIN